MTDKELQQLAREIATENYKHFGEENSIDLMAHEYEDVIKCILRTHCIVCRDFVKQQRKIIEFDKKLMLEKPTGERMMMAGVNQAKLELIDKLFDESTFEEKAVNEPERKQNNNDNERS